LIEIDVGEPDTPALPTVADIDVTERARGDVAKQRFDGAVQLGGGLGGGLEPVGGGLTRLARGSLSALVAAKQCLN
jgi:hypothetical protein